MSEIIITVSMEEYKMIQILRRGEESLKRLEERAKKAGKSVKEAVGATRGLDIGIDDISKKMEVSLRNSFLSLFAVGGGVSTAIGILISDIKKGFAEIDKQIEESGKKAQDLDQAKREVAKSAPSSVSKNITLQKEIIDAVLKENEALTRKQILDIISSTTINLVGKYKEDDKKAREKYDSIIKKIVVDASKFAPMVSPTLYAQYASALFESYGEDAIKNPEYIVSNIRRVGETNAQKVADSLKQLNLAKNAGLALNDIIALLNANISVTGGTEEALNILKKVIKPEEVTLTQKEFGDDATHTDKIARKALMKLSEKDRMDKVYKDIDAARLYFGQDISKEQFEKIKVAPMTPSERLKYYTEEKGIDEIFGSKGVTATPVLKKFENYQKEQENLNEKEEKELIKQQNELFKTTEQYKNAVLEAKKDQVSAEYEERLRKVSYLEEMIKVYQEKYPETTRYHLLGFLRVDWMRRDPLTKFRWAVRAGSKGIKQDLTDKKIQEYFINATDPYRQSARAHMIKGTLDAVNNAMVVGYLYQTLPSILTHAEKIFPLAIGKSIKNWASFKVFLSATHSIFPTPHFFEPATTIVGKILEFMNTASVNYSMRLGNVFAAPLFMKKGRLFNLGSALSLTATKSLDKAYTESPKGSALVKMIPLIGEIHEYWMNYTDVMLRNAEKEKYLLDVQKAVGFDISNVKYGEGGGLYKLSAYANPHQKKRSDARKKLQETAMQHEFYEQDIFEIPKLPGEIKKTPDEMRYRRYLLEYLDEIDEIKKIRLYKEKYFQQRSNKMTNLAR